MEQGGLMVVRYAFRTAIRAAAVTLLEDYKAQAMTSLNTYPGRPRTIATPHAFVDSIHETITYVGLVMQRVPTVEIIVLHGVFDSKEAVNQADAFTDGFLDWVADRFHSAGANTLVEIVEVEDLPSFVPEWLPPAQQETYYGTRFALEGFTSG
jgi:hypothetical protein